MTTSDGRAPSRPAIASRWWSISSNASLDVLLDDQPPAERREVRPDGDHPLAAIVDRLAVAALALHCALQGEHLSRRRPAPCGGRPRRGRTGSGATSVTSSPFEQARRPSRRSRPARSSRSRIAIDLAVAELKHDHADLEPLRVEHRIRDERRAAPSRPG